jgi:phospholipid/cholesterol/gamma-HCH transport system substrate-binding protein
MNRSLSVGTGVAALCAAGIGVAVAVPRVSGPAQHQFTITFPTASGLVAGSDVLEAGAKVGTIYSIQPGANDTAIVQVQIEGDHWPLHQGLQADIRPKSLLGEKYVDLHDGPAKNAAYNVTQVLHAPSDSTPVELDQFINSLDGDTRSALKILLNDLGAGLAGRGGDLNQAIQTGRDDLAHLAVTGQTLNNRDPDLDRILVGLDGVFQKITTDDQLTQMSQLIDNGKATLDAVEAEQASFTRSFNDAQVALAELNTSFDTVITNLRQTLDVAPHLLSEVTQESNLLADAGMQTIQGNNGQDLEITRQALQRGQLIAGGALEQFNDGSGLNMPIFRVCLLLPGDIQIPGSSGKSCTGNGYTGPTSQPLPGYSQSAYAGGASDIQTLASFLGD